MPAPGPSPSRAPPRPDAHGRADSARCPTRARNFNRRWAREGDEGARGAPPRVMAGAAGRARGGRAGPRGPRAGRGLGGGGRVAAGGAAAARAGARGGAGAGPGRPTRPRGATAGASRASSGGATSPSSKAGAGTSRRRRAGLRRVRLRGLRVRPGRSTLEEGMEAAAEDAGAVGVGRARRRHGARGIQLSGSPSPSPRGPSAAGRPGPPPPHAPEISPPQNLRSFTPPALAGSPPPPRARGARGPTRGGARYGGRQAADVRGLRGALGRLRADACRRVLREAGVVRHRAAQAGQVAARPHPATASERAASSSPPSRPSPPALPLRPTPRRGARARVPRQTHRRPPPDRPAETPRCHRIRDCIAPRASAPLGRSAGAPLKGSVSRLVVVSRHGPPRSGRRGRRAAGAVLLGAEEDSEPHQARHARRRVRVPDVGRASVTPRAPPPLGRRPCGVGGGRGRGGGGRRGAAGASGARGGGGAAGGRRGGASGARRGPAAMRVSVGDRRPRAGRRRGGRGGAGAAHPRQPPPEPGAPAPRPTPPREPPRQRPHRRTPAPDPAHACAPDPELSLSPIFLRRFRRRSVSMNVRYRRKDVSV